MKTIGYARVSTEEQNLDLQKQALERYGCDQIFEDHGISAVAKTRPGFEQAVAALTKSDTFVIWKMDRAFRSLRNALDLLETLEARGVEFVSLTDAIDTNTAMGKAMYQLRGVFSELERSLIAERTKAGMEAARKRGKHIGRQKKLTDEQVEWVVEQLNDGGVTITALAEQLGVSTHTLSRVHKRHQSKRIRRVDKQAINR